jgi:hypothetical protein
MNTTYDMTESAILIAKLLRLTRDNKIEWVQKRSFGFPEMAQYQTAIDGELEALVWSTNKEAGFRIFEKGPEPRLVPPRERLITYNADVPFVSSSPLLISERDLVGVSFDHENGAAQGEIYVNLISLLELARRSSDKIEPKIDRVKQYLDQLAV